MLGWWRQKNPPPLNLPHEEVEEEWSQKLMEMGRTHGWKWEESMT